MQTQGVFRSALGGDEDKGYFLALRDGEEVLVTERNLPKKAGPLLILPFP